MHYECVRSCSMELSLGVRSLAKPATAFLSTMLKAQRPPGSWAILPSSTAWVMLCGCPHWHRGWSLKRGVWKIPDYRPQGHQTSLRSLNRYNTGSSGASFHTLLSSVPQLRIRGAASFSKMACFHGNSSLGLSFKTANNSLLSWSFLRCEHLSTGIWTGPQNIFHIGCQIAMLTTSCPFCLGRIQTTDPELNTSIFYCSSRHPVLPNS